jgi:hypothetical protein
MIHIELFLFVCFGGIGIWTQGFVFAKQALYRLSHTSSHMIHIVLYEKARTWIHLSQEVQYPQRKKKSVNSTKDL